MIIHLGFGGLDTHSLVTLEFTLTYKCKLYAHNDVSYEDFVSMKVLKHGFGRSVLLSSHTKDCTQLHVPIGGVWEWHTRGGAWILYLLCTMYYICLTCYTSAQLKLNLLFSFKCPRTSMYWQYTIIQVFAIKKIENWPTWSASSACILTTSFTKGKSSETVFSTLFGRNTGALALRLTVIVTKTFCRFNG